MRSGLFRGKVLLMIRTVLRVMSQAKEPYNHRLYALLLETGLRTGD